MLTSHYVLVTDSADVLTSARKLKCLLASQADNLRASRRITEFGAVKLAQMCPAQLRPTIGDGDLNLTELATPPCSTQNTFLTGQEVRLPLRRGLPDVGDEERVGLPIHPL